MKKAMSLLLVFSLILAVFVLVGNGIQKGQRSHNADALSVAIVVSETFGDLSFNDSAKSGGEAMEENLRVNVDYIQCEGSDFKQNLMTAAEGHEMVVAVGWEFYEITEVAAENPDTRFIWVDNTADGVEEYPNLLCITYAQNEGSYLAGYIAAAMSTTGVVGIVGGVENNTMYDFFIGFKQGAKAADSQIKVVTDFVGSYDDQAAGERVAIKLAEQDADVIFQVAGDSGLGIFEAAKKQGFYVIGVDQDQKISARTYDDVIICSVIKEIGTSIYDIVKEYEKEGTWQGGRVWTADMSTGYIKISYGDEKSMQFVSDNLKSEVRELQREIVSGKIEVKTTRY